jgi:hypothetical protein
VSPQLVAQQQFKYDPSIFSIAQKYLANRARKDNSSFAFPGHLISTPSAESRPQESGATNFNPMKLFGFDVERVVWEYMVEVACNDWEFMDWGKGNKSQSGMCEQGRNCFIDIFGWSMRVKVKMMLALVGFGGLT